MQKTSKVASKPSKTAVKTTDEIATLASLGEGVSAFFTNKFTVVRPVKRTNA